MASDEMAGGSTKVSREEKEKETEKESEKPCRVLPKCLLRCKMSPLVVDAVRFARNKVFSLMVDAGGGESVPPPGNGVDARLLVPPLYTCVVFFFSRQVVWDGKNEQREREGGID